MDNLALLKLGYRIHNVLDEMVKLREWCQDHQYGADVADAMRPLDTAGQRLARLMLELTKPDRD